MFSADELRQVQTGIMNRFARLAVRMKNKYTLVQYGQACCVVAKLVEEETGLSARLVGLKNPRRPDELIPHWVNVTKEGKIVDLKARIFLKGTEQMAVLSEMNDGHYIPEGYEPENYVLKPTARDFSLNRNSHFKVYRKLYLEFLVLKGALPEDWQQVYSSL